MPANTEVSLTSAMSSKTTKGRTILSKAPTRIDLSGGTIDLWPLFLFFKNPITVNLGIDLFAETKLVESPLSPAPTEITLRSIDQNIELKLKWQSLEEDREVPPALILHYKLLKYFYLDSKEKREGLKKHNLPATAFSLTRHPQKIIESNYYFSSPQRFFGKKAERLL